MKGNVLRWLYLFSLLALTLLVMISLMTNHSLAKNLAENYEQLQPEQRQSLLERLPAAFSHQNGTITQWNFDSHSFDEVSIQVQPISDGELIYQKMSDSKYLWIHLFFMAFAFFFIQGFKGFRRPIINYTICGWALLLAFGGILVLFILGPLLQNIGIHPKDWMIIWLIMCMFIFSVDLLQRTDISGEQPILGYITGLGLFIALLALPSLHALFQSSSYQGLEQIRIWTVGILLTVSTFSVMLILIKFGLIKVWSLKKRISSYLIICLAIGIITGLQFGWTGGLALASSFALLLHLMDMTVEDKRINFLWLATWIMVVALVNSVIWWVLQIPTELTLVDVLNYFSLSFVIGMILLLLLILLQTFFPLVWGLKSLRIPSHLQLRHKIELATLGTLILAFVTIGGITYLLEKNRHQQLIKDQLGAVQYGAPSDLFLQDVFEIRLFDEDDLAFRPDLVKGKMDLPAYEVWNSDVGFNQPVIIENSAFWKEKNGGLSAFRPIEQTFLKAFSLSMLSKLFNLYVFLFLICLGVIYIIAQSITKPLFILGDQLESISLGKINPRIEWNQNDEIGDLIQRYNSMLDQLDHSAAALASTERDQAWKEMAKQVAHEIKNPLTPMKLSIQYLEMKTRGESGPLSDQVKKTAQTLIEQIDNMTRIAENFSQFGSLPKISNKKVLLNEVVTSVHDLFRKREDMDIQCRVPIDDCFVFADKDHLIRILNNIIKNAIQAIPHDRRGAVNISLERKDHHALVAIQDNGEGIPDDRINKIFQPNFTTKRSGTGLGLAMCSKMIDSMEGKIYFDTEVDKGTTFYVEIPLLRIEENYSEEEVSI